MELVKGKFIERGGQAMAGSEIAIRDRTPEDEDWVIRVNVVHAAEK